MKDSEKHITNVKSSVKKRWETPSLEDLDVNKTKSGDFDRDTEGSWWFFTWGPS